MKNNKQLTQKDLCIFDEVWGHTLLLLKDAEGKVVIKLGEMVVKVDVEGKVEVVGGKIFLEE